MDRIDWPFATVTAIDWAGEHVCTFDTHSMSLIAKYSPLDPESALARCDAEFVFVIVVKFENGWSAAFNNNNGRIKLVL